MAFQNIVMECRGCGASLSIDPTLRFATCPYCGNCNTLVRTDRAAETPAVEEVYPAVFSEQAFRSAVRAFLCTHPDVPDSLYESLSERELTLNFWPFYRHEIPWTAHWTADVGYDDENAKGGIGWQASSGQSVGTAVVYAPAASVIHKRGLGATACELAAANRDEPLKFTPDVFTGVSYLNCDVEAKAMEKQYVTPKLNAEAEAESDQQLPGEYSRNLHCTVRAESRSTTLQMIPFWLFVYEWEGNTYFVMQNAATGAVDGTLPSTSRRKWLAGLLSGAAFVLILLCSWILWQTRNPYDTLLFFALALPVAAIGMLYREAVTVRKARIKLAPVSEIGDKLKALRRFEKSYLSLSGIVIVGWIAVAVMLTLVMPVLLPKFWHDPVAEPRPANPRMTQSRNAADKPEKGYIKLKTKKVKGVTEEVSDEDGNSFVVEK